MRRVVVTGMGIVSSIGNNLAEVLESLKDAKPGIVFAEDYAELGFRCQVHGAPKLDPFEVLDRRTTRFMGKGAAWNYIAMQEAIAESGLEENDIKNPRTGIIMGSGGPSTRTVVEAADITREKGPKRIGPLAVPKAMSSTASATLATPFGIKGVNYTITSACATSKHCIGNGYEQIQWGKQDIVFAGGHEDLDWTLSEPVRRHGRHVDSTSTPRPQKASRAYDAQPRRLRHRRRRRRAGARGTRARQGARRHHLRRDSSAMARPRTATTWSRPRAKAPSAACAWRSRRSRARSTTSTRTPPRRRSATLKEIEAIRAVFGTGDKCPPISATKSLTGHSLGATGVQESIYCILMMQNRFLCESANIENLDPAFEDMPILRQRRDNVDIGIALSNSLRLRRHQRDAGVPAPGRALGDRRVREAPRSRRAGMTAVRVSVPAAR